LLRYHIWGRSVKILFSVAAQISYLHRWRGGGGVCTCLGLRVPSQCRCPGPGCHTGREGGRKCRPRALTKLLQYSRLARATTRWPQWVVLGGSPISPPPESPTIQLMPRWSTCPITRSIPRYIITLRFRGFVVGGTVGKRSLIKFRRECLCRPTAVCVKPARVTILEFDIHTCAC
jgi:hypothetical protein